MINVEEYFGGLLINLSFDKAVLKFRFIQIVIIFCDNKRLNFKFNINITIYELCTVSFDIFFVIS